MSNIQVNVRNEEMKKRAQIILKKLGMDMTTAINMFLVQVTIENGLPFQVKLNNTTVNGLTETEESEILQASFESKLGKNITVCETKNEVKEHLANLR